MCIVFYAVFPVLAEQSRPPWLAGDANPRSMKTHEGRSIDDLRQANILVVDHSKMNLAMIKKLLTRDGYDGVQTTQDPFSVASFCEEEAIDLVILDIKMPQLDGFGVINSIHEVLTEKEAPPVLIVTDVDEQVYRREALNYGALSKVFSMVLPISRKISH